MIPKSPRPGSMPCGGRWTRWTRGLRAWGPFPGTGDGTDALAVELKRLAVASLT